MGEGLGSEAGEGSLVPPPCFPDLGYESQEVLLTLSLMLQAPLTKFIDTVPTSLLLVQLFVCNLIFGGIFQRFDHFSDFYVN